MSVVVAIKEKGVVYMGADSQVTKGGTRTTLKNPNNYKIWKLDGVENALMGHVGNVRDANIIRTKVFMDDYDEFTNRINYKFVVKYTVPEIIKALRDAHFLKGKDDEYFDYMDSSFLLAYKDQLYSINSDGCVLEIDDYVAIGSGAPEAIGSLLSTEGMSPKERIIRAIKASAASDIYVDYPIIISNTSSTQFKVVTEDNEDQFLKENKKEVKDK